MKKIDPLAPDEEVLKKLDFGVQKEYISLKFNNDLDYKYYKFTFLASDIFNEFNTGYLNNTNQYKAIVATYKRFIKIREEEPENLINHVEIVLFLYSEQTRLKGILKSWKIVDLDLEKLFNVILTKNVNIGTWMTYFANYFTNYNKDYIHKEFAFYFNDKMNMKFSNFVDLAKVMEYTHELGATKDLIFSFGEYEFFQGKKSLFSKFNGDYDSMVNMLYFYAFNHDYITTYSNATLWPKTAKAKAEEDFKIIIENTKHFIAISRRPFMDEKAKKMADAGYNFNSFEARKMMHLYEIDFKKEK